MLQSFLFLFLFHPLHLSLVTVEYVSPENEYMQEARSVALVHSLDNAVKTGSVIVRDGVILGRGANGSNFHQTHECERVKQGIPTGEWYELCEGCHPKNHSERRALDDVLSRGADSHDADLYLWGHWWCCKPCWDAMISSGIKEVYLLEGSDILFNKNNTGNILGRWDT